MEKKSRVGIVIRRILFIANIFVLGYLMYLIFSHNLFPLKWRLLYVFLVILLEIFVFRYVFSDKNNTGPNIFVIALLLVFTLANGVAASSIKNGIDTLDGISNTNRKQKVTMSLVVQEDSKMKSLADVGDRKVYVANTQDKKNIDNFHALIINKYKKDLTYEDSSTYVAGANRLLDEKEGILLLNESYRSLIEEMIPNFSNKTRVILSEEMEHDMVLEEANDEPEKPEISPTTSGDSKHVKEKQSFNLYISGIDTYGGLSTLSRSDVNILLTINPETRKILMTSIPRDTYTEIAGGGYGYKDKLTHSGIYGIASTVESAENLLDVDINYYAKINFNSLIKLVDVLGGVEVYNKQEFVSRVGSYYFPYGDIYLNGEQALAFVRERYSLADGDFDRARNQRLVLEAMIKKAMSPAILFNYNDILAVGLESVETNMPKYKMIELINDQIDDGSEWEFLDAQLEGYGSMGLPSYAMPGSNLFMYVPYDYSIWEIHDQIEDVLAGR